MTPAIRAGIAAKKRAAWAAKPAEERSAMARKRDAAMTPEERSERGRQGARTKTPEARARPAARPCRLNRLQQFAPEMPRRSSYARPGRRWRKSVNGSVSPRAAYGRRCTARPAAFAQQSLALTACPAGTDREDAAPCRFRPRQRRTAAAAAPDPEPRPPPACADRPRSR
jgi:hypothetical protein